MKSNWPADVPVLTADDICREKVRDYHGRRCLLGWHGKAFGLRLEDDEDDDVHDALASVLPAGHCNLISIFNDDPAIPKALVATVWNRAMATLGYTEGNPEAKNAGKRVVVPRKKVQP